MKKISLRNNSICCYTVKREEEFIIISGHREFGGITPQVGDSFINCPFLDYQNLILEIKEIEFRKAVTKKYQDTYEFYTATCHER